jgi:hypothetical protein
MNQGRRAQRSLSTKEKRAPGNAGALLLEALLLSAPPGLQAGRVCNAFALCWAKPNTKTRSALFACKPEPVLWHMCRGRCNANFGPNSWIRNLPKKHLQWKHASMLA